MKKLLVSLLVATTTLSVVGCSTTKKTDEGTTTATNDGTGVSIKVQVEDSWQDYYAKVKENVLKAYPKATIDFLVTPSFDHLDVLDKTDATNADVADVFALPADRLYSLAQNQVLAAMDAEKMATEVGGFADFNKGLGGNFKIDGEYLAFPYNIETLIGFVNKANAEAAGVDTTKAVEMTTLKADQLLTAIPNAWFGVAFTNSVGFELLTKGTDGKLASDATKDWKDLSADQQKLFDGLYNYFKAHHDAKTDAWDKDAVWGYIDAQFKTGGSDIIKIDGPWGTSGVKDLVGSADNLEVMPLSNITFNGKALNHWKGGWGLGINARCEDDANKMEVAEAFIKEIVNPANAKDLFAATGKVLENAKPSSYEGIDALDKKVIDATYASYENAPARPLFTEYGKVWDTWQNALLSWSSTNPTNGEEAYKQVQEAFKAMMASY